MYNLVLVKYVHLELLYEPGLKSFTFKEGIISSGLCGTALTCVDDLVMSSYEVILSNLLNLHAPLKSRVVIVRQKYYYHGSLTA